MDAVETIELLPTVKAYPALSKKYGEVSCVAGVEMTPDGPRWIRLYPVPFRTLDDEQKFTKYQRIRVDVETHNSDKRPETRRPNRDSISTVGKPIPTARDWARRRPWVEPLIGGSMCELARRQKQNGSSLGAFRPHRVEDLIIEKVNVNKEREAFAKALAAQGSLLDGLSSAEHRKQLKGIEQIPYRFKYRYRCDDSDCKGHEQSIIDWEIIQFYRQVRRKADWETHVREKWIGELCSPERDTAFFVGNQHLYPKTFMVLGVWWPPKRPEQLTLG